MKNTFSWRRQIDIFILVIFLAPVLLVPLIFTGFNTNTIIIKETYLQFGVIYMTALLPFVWRRNHQEGLIYSYPSSFPLLLLGLALYLFYSAYGLSGHPRSIHEFTRWFSYLLLTMATIDFAVHTRRFLAYLYITIFVSLIISLYACLQAIGIEPFFNWSSFAWEDQSARRVCATLGNPDFLAGYLVALFPATITLAIVNKGILRRFFAAVAVIQGLALVLSYSRGGWMAAFFTALLLFSLLTYLNWVREPVLFNPRITLRGALAGLAAMTAAGAGALFFLWNEIAAAFFRLSSLTEGSSVATRLYFYKAAFLMWLERPWRGFGLGTFTLYFYEFRDKELSIFLPFRKHYLEHAHNEYLEILSETGLIGFLLYSLLLIAAARFHWRTIMKYRTRENLVLIGLGCGIIGLMLHNLSTVTLRQTPTVFLFWSFIGAAIGRAAYLNRRESTGSSRWIRRIWLLAIPFAVVLLFHEAIENYAGDCLMRSGHDLIKKTSQDETMKFNREKMEEALIKLHQSARLAPDRFEPYLWMALCYYKFFDYQQAREAYLQLDRLQHNFTSTPMNLSITALKRADYFIDYKKAIPPDVLNSLVENCGKEAISWIQAAIKDDPTAPEYYAILGRSYLKTLGAVDQAKEAFQRALKAEEKRPFENPLERKETENFLKSIQSYQANIEAASPEIDPASAPSLSNVDMRGGKGKVFSTLE
ncbi:MAG: O-antigen ligase family protein [Candidatus Omnitrophota bacterium]